MQWLAQRRAALPAGELRTRWNGVPGLIPYVGGAHILTDDKAPVELLGMRAIDDLIQQELAYYQEIYREEGLSGLLNRFFRKGEGPCCISSQAGPAAARPPRCFAG